MIKVTAKCIEKADKETGAVCYARSYLELEGTKCIQTRSISRESDYSNGSFFRYSSDNGKTWSDWQEKKSEEHSVMYGNDEMTKSSTEEIWNPVHGHFVSVEFTRYFLEGHKEAYRIFWSTGENSFFDHQYIAIRYPGDEKPRSVELIRHEDPDTPDFDPDYPRNPEFLRKNIGFINTPVVLPDGDIAVPVGATVSVGCRIAGIDVDTVFPSCPDICRCVIVARGRFDKEKGIYDFGFSNPVILGDLRSSRGIDEPQIAYLNSGRILLVMRGSNVSMPSWNTRIEKGTPGFKWYSYSDDGGKTFTQPEPWHFDDGEVIYSSATYSRFIRLKKSGKLYWIGNITDHTVYGNFPRYPLQIVEVDETTGAAMKDSLTVIDTRREGETERIQLSNFEILEDRETGILEVTLCKLGQFDERSPFFGESWQYDIEVE